MPSSQRRTGADACPGALDVHRAADGGLARIRVPGGLLRAEQLAAVAESAADLGDGTLELTSRANLQVRGLALGAEVDLAARLAEVGLLPSLTHEKVRNIMASPLGPVEQAAALDEALCARPELAGLPGRFLFVLDDGRGDVAWLGADVAALPVGDQVALLLGGRDFGVRLGPGEVVPAMLAAAAAFLELRAEQWRIAELGPDVAKIAAALGASDERVAIGAPPSVGPLGPVEFADGTPGLGAVAPLGRLTGEQASALGDVVLTPWRGLVARGRGPLPAGLVTDPAAPGIGVTACAGRPGCAKALADVRSAALGMPAGPGRPVHWSGCARRCGRPAGDVLDVVATEDGYLVGGRATPGDQAAMVAAGRRQEQQ
ncbi:hypothetical protein [Actinokineospora iranica]|uniref:Precorrin-3B synthase n=1 Tax=Actinokineospora iranica TaxID=1271860 RepID=A0A1G6J2U9_9PSEU|nr:hypothetical protein [Actinokineospora iranica]SDC12980.1 precorrin-3B synthase [Actinokineospora iranica]